MLDPAVNVGLRTVSSGSAPPPRRSRCRSRSGSLVRSERRARYSRRGCARLPRGRRRDDLLETARFSRRCVPLPVLTVSSSPVATSPVLSTFRGQLVTQLRVGLDEVDEATVLGALGPGEAQGAGLSDADRAPGFRPSCHRDLLTPATKCVSLTLRSRRSGLRSPRCSHGSVDATGATPQSRPERVASWSGRASLLQQVLERGRVGELVADRAASGRGR